MSSNEAVRLPHAALAADQRAALYCRSCGRSHPVTQLLQGCPYCSTPDVQQPVEMRYPASAIREAFDAPYSSERGVWAHAAALPPAASPVSLGEGRTPLLEVPNLAREYGTERVWLKFEGAGPTGSWKDRLNSLAVTMAREAGAPGIACSSTGNHGVSLAAYAAAAGLPAVVLLPVEAPRLSAQQALLHGAKTVVTDWRTRAAVIDTLLRYHGWSLSNRNDPNPWGNPFGIEGYRTIAFEIVRELGGVPDAVLVPTCGADGLYGIWKGFRELEAAGVVDRHPRMIAVQPEVSDSLVRAIATEANEVPETPLRPSIALSLTDQRSGRLGLAAVRESGGTALRVSEDEIVNAIARLGRLGICAEPAAAAGVAALVRLPEGIQTVVVLVTAGGLRWPSTFRGTRSIFESSDVDAIVTHVTG